MLKFHVIFYLTQSDWLRVLSPVGEIFGYSKLRGNALEKSIFDNSTIITRPIYYHQLPEQIIIRNKQKKKNFKVARKALLTIQTRLNTITKTTTATDIHHIIDECIQNITNNDEYNNNNNNNNNNNKKQKQQDELQSLVWEYYILNKKYKKTNNLTIHAQQNVAFYDQNQNQNNHTFVPYHNHNTTQHTNNLPHSTNSKLQTKGIKKITKTKKQWFKTSAFKTNSDNINTTYLKHINSKIKSKEKEKEKENKKNKKQYTISSTFHNNNNKDIQFTTRKVKLKLTNSNQKKLKEWFCVLTELQNIIANDFNNTVAP